MKKTWIFISGALFGLIFAIGAFTVAVKAGTGILGVQLPADQGVIITPDESKQLTSAYSSRFPGNNDTNYGLFGGRIGKSALEKLLNNMSSSQQYVNFRYGYQSVPGSPDEKFFLILSPSGFSNLGPSSLIIRNGGDAESFCPTRCD
jgi:hypothetical protein